MKQKANFFEITLMAAGILVPLIWTEVSTQFFEFSIIELIIPLMVIGFILRAKKENLNLKPNLIDRIFLALLIWVGTSLIKAIDFDKSLHEFVWLVESFLVFYMVSHSKLNKNNFERLLRIWVYGAVIISLLAISQYYYNFTGEGITRVNATHRSYNSLSGYLIIYIPIMISLMYWRKIDQRIFWWVLLTITTTALVATYTRGGWYAIIFTVIIMSLLLRSKGLIPLMILYILVYSWTFPMAQERVVAGLNPVQDQTGVSRIQFAKSGFNMWKEHPIEGVGIGNFPYSQDEYVKENPYIHKGWQAMDPHNSFVKFLSENGIVGLGLFLSLLLGIAWHLINLFCLLKNEKETVLYSLFVGILGSFIAFSIQSNSNDLYQDPRVAFGIWLVLGLGHALYLSKVSLTLDSPQSVSAGRLRVEHKNNLLEVNT